MKPGMYVATVRGVVGVRVYGPSKTGNWVTLAGGTWDRLDPSHVSDARPLVVLDPESDEDCAAIAAKLTDMDNCVPWTQDQASTILRALAAPTTPNEPRKLGAVVPLHDGGHAVRIATLPSGRGSWALVDPVGMPGDCVRWTDVVKLIEPGWTS